MLSFIQREFNSFVFTEPKRNQPRIPLAAAQKIIKDLSVNIRMKEELILALDKTGVSLMTHFLLSTNHVIAQ